MAGTGRKWAIGCGIGCGLMLIILGGAGTCTYFGVKKIQEQADGLDAGFAQIESRFGAATDFVPDPTGVIAPERMETFLAVRDSMAPTRHEMSRLLTSLDGDANWLVKARAGMKLVPALLGFMAERNRILVDQEIGVGEYQYIYSLAYFALLQMDPGDGPGFVLAEDDHDRADEGNVRVRWGSGGDKEKVREQRARRVRAYVNRNLTQILENQLEALRTTLPSGAAPQDDPWGAELTAEVAAMREETLRLPWEEGLPPPLLASLTPYRERLVASYDPMTSIIEIGLADED